MKKIIYIVCFKCGAANEESATKCEKCDTWITLPILFTE